MSRSNCSVSAGVCRTCGVSDFSPLTSQLNREYLLAQSPMGTACDKLLFECRRPDYEHLQCLFLSVTVVWGQGGTTPSSDSLLKELWLKLSLRQKIDFFSLLLKL